MKEIPSLSILTSNENNINNIYRVSNQLQNFCKKMAKGSIYKDECNQLYINIQKVLMFWTGGFYVGVKKEVNIQKAFQSFFMALENFLIACSSSAYRELKDFSERALYNGKLYRYLGYATASKPHLGKIIPSYNNIYVSWSKSQNNAYLLEKLKGAATLLICSVEPPLYGIDLCAFSISRGNEEEVVFPTIKETIISIS